MVKFSHSRFIRSLSQQGSIPAHQDFVPAHHRYHITTCSPLVVIAVKYSPALGGARVHAWGLWKGREAGSSSYSSRLSRGRVLKQPDKTDRQVGWLEYSLHIPYFSSSYQSVVPWCASSPRCFVRKQQWFTSTWTRAFLHSSMLGACY